MFHQEELQDPFIWHSIIINREHTKAIRGEEALDHCTKSPCKYHG